MHSPIISSVSVLSALLSLYSGMSYAADTPPQGYVFLCNEGETCDAGTNTNVGYGAKGVFAFRMLCGKFVCMENMFKRGAITGLTGTACYVPAPAPTDTTSGADKDCAPGGVIRNKVVDCKGKRISMGCKADNEYQPPILTLANATVKNLVIAADGASDGIHCVKGDCTLENVVWEDICEDAASHLSEGGTMTIIGGSAFNSKDGFGGKPDKIFQHNSKNSTFIITGGFTAKGVNGKMWRSCGTCYDNGGPRHLIIEDAVVEGELTAGVARLNTNYGDTATIKKIKIKNYKEEKPSVCTESEGVSKEPGLANADLEPPSEKTETWDTTHCIVSKSAVTSY